MKSKLLPFLALVLLSALLPAQNSEQSIDQVLDSWHLAAAEANFEAYFSNMTTDAVFIGTDATENWELMAFREFSKPYFDQGKAWSFKAVQRNIYIDRGEQLAWFDELLDTWMGICRGSGVLKLEDGTWKITHYVLSAAIPNDDMQQVINIKKEKDSLQLLELTKHKNRPNKE